MAQTIAIGDPAPDFTLHGISDGQRADFTLSNLRGSPVVLAFYPGDGTPVCTAQLCSYQSDLSLLTDLGATVWGISAQDVDSHERFAAREKLSFPLLADTEGTVIEAYGAKGRNILGISALSPTKRAIVVIDAEGIVRYLNVPKLGLTFQHAAALAEIVKGLPGSR